MCMFSKEKSNDNGKSDQSSKTILIFKPNHLRICCRYVFSFGATLKGCFGVESQEPQQV